MMSTRFSYVLPLILAFLLLVNAQSTVTTTNGAGQTIIQVITTNPQGLPVTQVVSTAAGTATTAVTTAPATTPPPVIPGPVAQPPGSSGTPGAPTPFTYTTIVGGVTSVVAATFTPTSPSTTPLTAPAVGTIYDYSSWVSIYGPPKSAGGSRRSLLLETSALSLAIGALGWAMLL